MSPGRKHGALSHNWHPFSLPSSGKSPSACQQLLCLARRKVRPSTCAWDPPSLLRKTNVSWGYVEDSTVCRGYQLPLTRALRSPQFSPLECWLQKPWSRPCSERSLTTHGQIQFLATSCASPDLQRRGYTTSETHTLPLRMGHTVLRKAGSTSWMQPRNEYAHLLYAAVGQRDASGRGEQLCINHSLPPGRDLHSTKGDFSFAIQAKQGPLPITYNVWVGGKGLCLTYLSPLRPQTSTQGFGNCPQHQFCSQMAQEPPSKLQCHCACC